jgi:hypothetical protein
VKKLAAMLVVGFAVAMVLGSPAFAHHGNAAYENKTVTVKGVVTEWKWTNPHTFLKFDAKNEKGEMVHWIGEWNAPSTLIKVDRCPERVAVASGTGHSLPPPRRSTALQ